MLAASAVCLPACASFWPGVQAVADEVSLPLCWLQVLASCLLQIPVLVSDLDLECKLWLKIRLAPMCPYFGTISLAFVGSPTIKVQLLPYNRVRLMRIPVLQVSHSSAKCRTICLTQLLANLLEMASLQGLHVACCWASGHCMAVLGLAAGFHVMAQCGICRVSAADLCVSCESPASKSLIKALRAASEGSTQAARLCCGFLDEADYQPCRRPP